MKPILIATDFSPAATNAADYAAQLSKLMGAPLVLFHAWSLPVMTGETLAMPVTIDDIEKEQAIAVRKEAQRIENTWGVKVDPQEKAGFAADEIVDYCREHNIGMVIMGIRHHTSKMGRWLGSVSTAFIGRSEVPALIIPEGKTFHQPSTLLFATDLHTQTGWKEFDTLKDIAEKLKSEVHIVNAVETVSEVETTEGRSGIQLEGRLRDFPHTWHFQGPGEGTVLEAISNIAKEISADWIVAVPHHLPFLQQLFHASLTKKLAFETDRPLLVLPEQHVQLD